MNTALIRKIIAFIYTLIMLLFIGLGFLYTNETTNEYRENTLVFDDYWKVDDKYVLLPYSSDSDYTIENTLPTVYGDQLLIMRADYNTFQVSIDGEPILEPPENVLFGRTTNVGKKEIWIPLKAEYSNKDISITISPQKALFRSQLTEVIISTRSAYGILQLKNSVPSVILFFGFAITGLLEIGIAIFFIIRHTLLIRKLTFEALFYAGCFSLVSAIWVICEARIPFIVFGHITGFSVLTIISFILMPLLFLEMTRALFIRISRVDNIIDGTIAFIIFTSCLLSVCGIVEWGNLVYLAHLIDITVMIIVAYYSYDGIKREKSLSSRTGIAISNCVFILLALLSLAQYINNLGSNYYITIMLDLMIYIMVQIGLLYRRIGLNVKQETEFTQAKIFAYTDELTKLGNRRLFDTVIRDYERHKLPKNLSYIAIDVNRLKYYNDTMGHGAGDELLIGTSECIQRAFESSTTATIGRLGGDEFGILLVAEKSELERRIAMLEGFLEKWSRKYIKGISVSLGTASIREDEYYSIADLSKLADERMYEQKKQFYETSGFDRRRTT